MAAIKLTKNELRVQQSKLHLLHKYLPTLQLKKAMLQGEVALARSEIGAIEMKHREFQAKSNACSSLAGFQALESSIRVIKIKKRYENIAGVEVPYFEEAVFAPFEYFLFDTPAWQESAIFLWKQLKKAESELQIVQEKKTALENELQEVSIRVNLFEKILIPRAEASIKKIKVFLGDQQLASVCRAKVAKAKIMGRQKSAH